jgi:preprotein translocase subunit YajC
MSNSSKNTTIIFLVAMAVIIAFLVIDNNNKTKQIKDLKKGIDENEDLTKEIKQKLTELIENNLEVEPKIASELTQISALIEIKQDNSAVLKLAKIIENLLIELYKGDSKVKEIAKQNNRKNPVFADYIEHGRNEKVISSEDYHQLSVLKIIRNEEAHQLDIKNDKSRIVSPFICGVGLVLALCRMLKKKTILADVK